MSYVPQQKWQKENLKSVGTKLTKADYEKFAQYCKERDISLTAAIKKLILDAINSTDK